MFFLLADSSIEAEKLICQLVEFVVQTSARSNPNPLPCSPFFTLSVLGFAVVRCFAGLVTGPRVHTQSAKNNTDVQMKLALDLVAPLSGGSLLPSAERKGDLSSSSQTASQNAVYRSEKSLRERNTAVY